MVIDAVAVDSYMMVNRRAAALFGLGEATYISEILNIGKTVIRKNKLDENGYMKLDRKFIERQTTIPIEDQLTYDAALSKNGILEICPDDKNKVGLHADVYMALITTQDEEILKKVAKDAKPTARQKAAGKKEGMLMNLQAAVLEAAPNIDAEVKDAIFDWIEVVFEKGVCKKVQIKNFMEELFSYSLDKSTQIELIKTLTKNAWRDLQYAVNRYESQHRTTLSAKPSQKVATIDSVNLTEYF